MVRAVRLFGARLNHRYRPLDQRHARDDLPEREGGAFRRYRRARTYASAPSRTTSATFKSIRSAPWTISV